MNVHVAQAMTRVRRATSVGVQFRNRGLEPLQAANVRQAGCLCHAYVCELLCAFASKAATSELSDPSIRIMGLSRVFGSQLFLKKPTANPPAVPVITLRPETPTASWLIIPMPLCRSIRRM